MKLMLRALAPEDSWDDVRFVIVEISAFQARRILQQIQFVGEARETKGTRDMLSIDFLDYSTDFCAPKEDFDGTDQGDLLESRELIVVDDHEIPEHDALPLDFCRMRIDHQDVHWIGRLKHAEYEIDTSSVPAAVLQRIAESEE
jgi:hypothetical protein